MDKKKTDTHRWNPLTSTPTSRMSLGGVWCQWQIDGVGSSTARSQTQLYASDQYYVCVCVVNSLLSPYLYLAHIIKCLQFKSCF